MPRITKEISNKPEEDDRIEKKSIKRVEGFDTSKPKSEKREAKSPEAFIPEVSHLSNEETAKWLIDFLGKDVFENIKNNADFSLPFTYEELSLEEWLVKALKTVCQFEDIEKIAENIRANYFVLIENLEKAEKIIETKNETIEQKEKRIKEVYQAIEEINDKKEALKTDLAVSIPIRSLFEFQFANHKETKGIARLITEALETPSEELNDFILNFLKGWSGLLVDLGNAYETEEEKVQAISQNLTELLAAIKDKTIPQRRALLDAVARFVSGKIKNFDFISPEETLQIDTDIHNAKGVGGNRIKQGISFAIVRKENRQTYQYADIEVY